MARLGNYPIDTTLSRTDKFLGTNADGTTRNFTVDGVRTFFNQDSAAGAADELNYKFKDSTTNTIGVMSTDGVTAFASISTIKIHEKANGLEGSVSNFFSEFVNKDIVIIDTDDLNKYGVYTCTAVAADSGNSGLYDLTLSYRSGNGSLVTNQFYSILLYSGSQDKDFTYNRNNNGGASTTWSIQHNLNKFPSVMITTNAGEQVQANISHTDKNNLTITFAGAVSGYAYLN
jgi:hypothetical protein|tara:strand:- start:334 stop:1026 length:693 start_codon:yes stop_codon:yes gene_type:complete